MDRFAQWKQYTKCRLDISASKQLVGVLMVLWVMTPSTAMTYQRWLTCRQPDTVTETTPTQSPYCGSRESGLPFFWPDPTVLITLNEKGTSSFPVEADGQMPDALREAITKGFEAWNEPDCSPFRFTVEKLTPNVVASPIDQLNLVTWNNDEWLYTQATIAVTSSTITPTGEVVDSDIELNGQFYDWTINPDDPNNINLYDVQNVITHEAGHVLGLDHPAGKDTTMYFESDPGEVKKRTLSDDDIAGLCAIYPVPKPTPAPPDDDTGCCAQVSHKPNSRHLELLMALAFLVGVRQRKKAPKAQRIGTL